MFSKTWNISSVHHQLLHKKNKVILSILFDFMTFHAFSNCLPKNKQFTMSEITNYLNLVNSLQFTNINGTQFWYKHNFGFWHHFCLEWLGWPILRSNEETVKMRMCNIYLLFWLVAYVWNKWFIVYIHLKSIYVFMYLNLLRWINM